MDELAGLLHELVVTADTYPMRQNKDVFDIFEFLAKVQKLPILNGKIKIFRKIS